MRSSGVAATFLLSLPLAVTAVEYGQWAPPGPGDQRCPCPALNTLANHGFLPRNGRGMTLPILEKGLKEGINVGKDFADFAGSGGLLAVQGNALATSFDLGDLKEHNFPIEHDASLSRADYYVSPNMNNYSFNQTIFNQVLAYYKGATTTNIKSAAMAKYHRVQVEQAEDPKFVYTAQQFVLSYGETALYISVLGDPVTGVAPVDYVKVFFEQERLPYKEGWKKNTAETNLATLAAMIPQLYLASGEAVPEGLLVTNQTIGQSFGGFDPLTGLLAHIA